MTPRPNGIWAAPTAMVGAFALVALGATAVAGCASMTVGSHLEQRLDHGVYLTYDWGTPDALPTGDPRFDNSSFFQDYVQGAVEKQLARKGIERVESGSPDLLIHYHANVTDRVDAGATDRQYSYGDRQVVELELGTLVVDVIDARTNKLVWRGWSQASIVGAIDDQDQLNRQVEGVVRMFERFPFFAPRFLEPPEPPEPPDPE